VFLGLQDLLYIEADDEQDEDDDEDEDHREGNGGDDDDSSSDDNDSTAAAHAAILGQSAHLTPPTSKAKQGIAETPADATKGETVEAIRAQEGASEKPTVEPAADKAVEQRPSGTEDLQEGSQHHRPSPTAMDIDPAPQGSTVEEKSKEKENGDKDPRAASAKSPESPISPKLRKLQLDPSIHLNERDDDENTALHVAIHCRKLEHVRLLLEAGASCRLKCDGSWPLHTAISVGALRAHRQFAYECVVLLQEHGADLAAKDDALHTPLFLACMYNLAQVASYILADEEGESTLNLRADRAGNRPLHAAAKYDTPTNPSFSKAAAANVTGIVSTTRHHHPDGTVDSSMHLIPSVHVGGKQAKMPSEESQSSVGTESSEALLTQLLLGSNGIEIDALNVMGQSPLHIACLRANWPVVRLLLEAGADARIADRRGYTPGQLAYKRGLFIPNDLVDSLGDPPETGVVPPARDLIVDPDGTTVILCHELCILHRTCPPIRRDSQEPPPENVRRLQVLIDPDTGILRTGEFGDLVWHDKTRRAAIGDVLKVHEYTYVESISQMASTIPDHPNAIAHLDPDTAISHWSFEAAMRAAGSICEAVDKVVAGECRNAFCAVRPPGHHAGPRGIVRCPNDPEGGSHGFCLLNNVAIGAAYARCMYRNEGIRRVAIIDFDVHHGNGTEEIIRQLVPTNEKAAIRTPFASGELTTSNYRPWLDETDIQNVFFASTHGYGHRGYDQPGWFYPASGKTHTSEAIAHPAMVENPNLTDFLLSQTWARMGDDSKMNCCKIINIGLELPAPDEGDPMSRSMKQRMELRDTYRNKILPYLREFDPDLIFISAGFDGHRKDTMNFGYVGMVEDDYEWVTEQLVKVANTCCNGRVISVLEGGYKIHGGIVSPFARSVASHVRALVEGGRSRELYDPQEGAWESQFEHHLYERRERKKDQEREQVRLMEETTRQHDLVQLSARGGGTPEDPDAPLNRKRKRNPVDYKELYKQMQQEGFAG
jgi:acetoin utilization deacetylase AcuC-like enzyme/ankyrin repeat protein